VIRERERERREAVGGREKREREIERQLRVLMSHGTRVKEIWHT